MKKIMISCILGISFILIQACTNTSENKVVKTNSSSNSNSSSSMPKEFGSRFSTKNIKAERETFYAQKLLELRGLSPVAEVNKAITSNNIHLLVVPAGRGGAKPILGLSNLQAQSINCSMQNVAGMGDVLYGENHALYRQELSNYMRRFNALMAPYCK